MKVKRIKVIAMDLFLNDVKIVIDAIINNIQPNIL